MKILLSRLLLAHPTLRQLSPPGIPGKGEHGVHRLPPCPPTNRRVRCDQPGCIPRSGMFLEEAAQCSHASILVPTVGHATALVHCQPGRHVLVGSPTEPRDL